jgi:hypothetical protein
LLKAHMAALVKPVATQAAEVNMIFNLYGYEKVI